MKASHFLHFVGGAYYTRDSFVAEAERLGISRRMPSSRVPEDLVSGESRVYVAFGGGRPTEKEPHPVAEVIGYFVPTAVEFIAPGGPDRYVDLLAPLKLRDDTRVIDTVEGEPQRGCGYRKAGGTYLVVDKADSPLVLFDEPVRYEGCHFRGLKRLTDAQVHSLDNGLGVSEMVDEACQNCGAAMTCSPDSHERAEVQRRRIDKGKLPTWRLLCPRCARLAFAEKLRETIAAKKAAASTTPVADLVRDQVASGAAPALATNPTIRELIAAEADGHLN